MAELGARALADDEARGIVMALRRMGLSEAALARVAPERRVVCAALWSESPLPAGPAELAAEPCKAALTAMLPPGMEQLHPSWIVEAVRGEPDHIVAVVNAALPEPLKGLLDERASVAAAPLAIASEVVRLAWAPLAVACVRDAGAQANALCRLSFEDLENEVTRKGACTVGHSLAGATAVERARVMASVGEPWSLHVRAAAAEADSASARAAVALLKEVARLALPQGPVERLQHVGVLALRAELRAEHPASPARVAGRLRVQLGRLLLEGAPP